MWASQYVSSQPTLTRFAGFPWSFQRRCWSLVCRSLSQNHSWLLLDVLYWIECISSATVIVWIVADDEPFHLHSKLQIELYITIMKCIHWLVVEIWELVYVMILLESLFPYRENTYLEWFLYFLQLVDSMNVHHGGGGDILIIPAKYTPCLSGYLAQQQFLWSW